MTYLNEIKIFWSRKSNSISFDFRNDNVFFASLTLSINIYPSKWEILINNFLKENDAILTDENFYRKINKIIKEIKEN